MPSGIPAPRSHDRLATVWFSVTVRVAWDLMLAGIRVRPAILQDARDHALASLPEGAGADEAEILAGAATQNYLTRVRDGQYHRLTDVPDTDLVIHRAWRESLFLAVDPVGDAVLRLHYGDGMDMAAVERTAAIDGTLLLAAQEGIRELVREIVESAEIDGWVDARVDGLIHRIVGMSASGCPEPIHLLSDAMRSHVDKCPRCSRAVRLIRGGVIAPLDLVAPGGETPMKMSEVAAILLHPDARKHRKRVVRALGPAAISAGHDSWLLSRADLISVGPELRALTEDAHPPRHQLRGAVVTGPGRWSGTALLGPVAIQALDAARARPWSEVDELGELPAPRPPPPRATWWWVGAGVAAVASALVGALVLTPEAPPPATPIAVEFKRIGSDWLIRFDADEIAVVDVVSVSVDGLTLLHSNVSAGKGRWATGQGDFELLVPGSEVALIASESGIPELLYLVGQSRGQPTPMLALQNWVKTAHPSVDFVASPAIIKGDPAVPVAKPPKPGP